MIRFGGTDGDHLYNDIWAFDLQARAWAQVPAVGFIPVPRTDFAAAAVNGVMYVFGGRGPDGQDLGDLCAFKMRSKFQMYDLSIKNQTKPNQTHVDCRSSLVYVSKYGTYTIGKIRP